MSQVNTNPCDKAEDNKMEVDHTNLQNPSNTPAPRAATEFGTFVPSETLPRETFDTPFDSPESLAYLYCAQCGRVSELNEWGLEASLNVINMLSDTKYTVADIGKNQYYVHAEGCPRCSTNVTAMTLALHSR